MRDPSIDALIATAATALDLAGKLTASPGNINGESTRAARESSVAAAQLASALCLRGILDQLEKLNAPKTERILSDLGEMELLSVGRRLLTSMRRAHEMHEDYLEQLPGAIKLLESVLPR